MKKFMWHISLWLLSIFCPIYSAFADKLYQIEMLVFEQPDKHSLEQEWWPENPGAPNLDNISPISFIPPTQLKKPTNAKILLHTAWKQPVGDKNQTPYIKIANQNNLEGTIHINSSRFLHANLDLIFQKNMNITRKKPGLLGASLNPNISGEIQMLQFRLKQSQKIKLNEVRYYDHPAFGVMLIVNTEG